MARWWLLLGAGVCWGLTGLVLLDDSDGQRPGPGHAVPERIVSLAPNLPEILFALGAGDRVVAVTSHCNWPPEALAKAKVGTFWQPSLESIVKARPDLVVALALAPQRILTRRLELMGYRCLVLDIETVGQLTGAIEILGAELGCPDRASALNASLAQRLARASQTSGPRPSVLWVVQRRPLRVAGQRTFINELIELAGGRNAVGPTLYAYPPIGAEQVAACQPEVIIEPVSRPGARGADREGTLEFWRKFPEIPAVTRGRIYAIDEDVVSRLGPRIVDGVEQIARCLQSPAPNPQPPTRDPQP
jgi:iron complex transport system substrate-binding protein